MSYAPRTLLDLQAYWVGRGGVPLGIVGNDKHTVGYHLGRDRIYGPGGQGSDDYSVKHPRDKAGLSGAAAAIDLGKLAGEYAELYAFSRWLVATSKAGGDIREIIYSPDGERVQRWSGIDGKIHTGPGNGDLSHRTHTHISYFRDSENRSKVPAFAGYWEDGTDVAIRAPGSLTSEYRLKVPDGTTFYADADCTDSLGKVENEAELVYVGAPLDEATPARAAIRITAAPYSDGQRYPTVVYFKEAEVGEPYRVEDPTSPDVPSTAPDVLTGDDGSVYKRA